VSAGPSAPDRRRRSDTLPAVSPAWQAVLDAFTEDLRRRAVAAKTSRAYGIDSRQFARWATAHHLQPSAVDVRALRRYVAARPRAR
jgi:site-specific recombinase XerD